jgi:hypothetical protein
VPGLNAEGMRLSVECAEGFSRLDLAAQAAADAAHPDLAPAFRSFPELIACEAWPVSAADEAIAEPVTSDVPVLLISGAFDPITPPAAAELAAETLTEARVHVVPFGSHGAGLTDPCAIATRDAFFSDPTRSTPTTCDAAVAPFVTDVAAHAGAVRAWTEIWLRTRPWARAPFEPILGGIGLISVSMIIIGVVRLVRRGRSGTWFLGAASASLLLACASLVAWTWVVHPSAALYGLPAAIGWLPLLGLAAAIVAALFGVAVVRAWVRRTGSWRARTFLTVVAVATGTGLWLLGSYGLIGFG